MSPIQIIMSPIQVILRESSINRHQHSDPIVIKTKHTNSIVNRVHDFLDVVYEFMT